MHEGVIILCFINQQLREAEPSEQEEHEQHAGSRGPSQRPEACPRFCSPLHAFAGRTFTLFTRLSLLHGILLEFTNQYEFQEYLSLILQHDL